MNNIDIAESPIKYDTKRDDKKDIVNSLHMHRVLSDSYPVMFD